jgi:hypothetical protein
MFIYFLSNLGMGGGGSAVVVPPVYVDPTQVVILSEDAGPGDVDPTQVQIIS